MAASVRFQIHPSSGVPIYRQIIDQVHALVAGGKLRPGDLLPSVRTVARAADVNPMTVSKAYSQLESAGVVERVRGQGMRVLAPADRPAPKRRRAEFRDLLAAALHRGRQLGLDDDQIQAEVDDLLAAHDAATAEQTANR
ncbi:MAG: GntR family transcriptional regulator [Planctomycetaceae bacterium]|nr:GntR family transcriptional regulator [Planctomycetaceae bacterium]